jgi:hypothetical protein
LFSAYAPSCNGTPCIIKSYKNRLLLLIHKNGNRDFFTVAADVVALKQRWPYSPSRPVCSIGAAFWSLSESVCRLYTINSAQFDSILWINLPCEEVFRQMMIITSRYRRRLTGEHVKHCLHLCLSNYEPSFSKLSEDMQCHGSDSQ